MKSLEEQLKESFDHFEPEVNSSVWAKVSQQLPGSTVPSGDVSSVIKAASVNSGVVTSWIAAAAAIIAGAGLIYYISAGDSKSVQKEVPVVVPPKGITQEINSPSKEKEVANNSVHASSIAEKAKAENKDINTDTQSAKQEEVVNATYVPNETGSHSAVDHQPATSSSMLPTTSAEAVSANKEMTSGHSENTPSAAIQSTAKTLPEPILILNTRGGFAPLTVTAMSNQVNQAADFDFGDGHQSDQTASASNRYDEPGSYTVTCKINGKTLETTVEVLDQVSSAFSPNGDGVNDLFTIGSNDIQSVEINIFNRYGKQVFKGKGKIVSWDGRVQNGANADSGTYFYDIFVTTVSGSTYKQKGSINLFR